MTDSKGLLIIDTSMLLSLIRMPTIAWYLYAKHWEKFPSVFGGHLISPRKEEGSDAYPRVGGK